MLGMALAGLTKGRVALSGEPSRPHERVPTVEEYYRAAFPRQKSQQLRKECAIKGTHSMQP